MSVKARDAAIEAAKELCFQGANIRSIVTGALNAYEDALDVIDPIIPAPGPDPKPIPAPGGFQIYSLLRYANTPNLRNFGIQPTKIWYESAFQKDGLVDSMPPDSVITDLAKKGGMLSILDLENAIKKNEWKATPELVTLYRNVMRVYKSALQPGARVGFYATAPRRNYFAALDGPGSARHDSWKRENDIRQPLANEADILFPSLYTLTVDEVRMEQYMLANLDEAARMRQNAGKPGMDIVPFLWPQIHSSAVDVAHRNKPVPAALFRKQLEICYDWGCDGVVLWHLSATKTIDFKDAGPWWDEVVDFLKTHPAPA